MSQYEVKNRNEDLIWEKNDIGYRTKEKEKILIVSAQNKADRQKRKSENGGEI